jgi:peptidoglycan-associated lipoprotein
MRRVFWWNRYLVVVLFLALAIAGCGKKQPPPEVEEPVVVEPPPPAEDLEAKRRAEEEEARRREEERKREFEQKMSVMIHFDFDRYDIKEEYKSMLNEKAQLLRDQPTATIQIEGHCDEWGTNEYNLALGERRANAAEDFLVAAGVSTDRISTVSFGEEKSLDPGHSKESWAQNRRAEFKVTAW